MAFLGVIECDFVLMLQDEYDALMECMQDALDKTTGGKYTYHSCPPNNALTNHIS